MSKSIANSGFEPLTAKALGQVEQAETTAITGNRTFRSAYCQYCGQKWSTKAGLVQAIRAASCNIIRKMSKVAKMIEGEKALTSINATD